MARKSMPPEDAVKLAREEIEAERRARAAKTRGLKADVKSRVTELDPFGRGGGVAGGGELVTSAPASRQQKKLLVKVFRYYESEVAAMSAEDATRATRRGFARRRAT